MSLLEVVLLETTAGRVFFYADPPALEGEAACAREPPRGVRERIEAWRTSWSARWRHSHGRAARWCRAVWEWLHARTHPDEPLLARLRGVESVELFHPSNWSEGDVRAGWSSFLKASRRRHWPWFVINLAVAPLTIVLVPLPGPNLIGYWIAYRAIHHGLILYGVGKTLRGRVATRLRADARLNRDNAEPAVRLAALSCAPEAVAEFLRRHRVQPALEVTDAA